MLSKEQLLAIDDLNLADKIRNMDDKSMADYCKNLDIFIENYPTMEAKLKKAFELRNYDLFSKILTGIKELLNSIYADGLVKECDKLNADIKTSRHEKVEAFLTYLLTGVSMLSIDIQMMQHHAKDKIKKEEEKPEEENGKKDGGEESETATEEIVRKKILAVDDVSLLLSTLKSILQNAPYDFIGVNSGQAALRYIKNNRPDLFLLDIDMPGMDGYELAKQLRASGQFAPIIFLTGNSTKDYVLKAVQAGGADFIVKPVNSVQVLDKINKHLG